MHFWFKKFSSQCSLIYHGQNWNFNRSKVTWVHTERRYRAALVRRCSEIISEHAVIMERESARTFQKGQFIEFLPSTASNLRGREIAYRWNPFRSFRMLGVKHTPKLRLYRSGSLTTHSLLRCELAFSSVQFQVQSVVPLRAHLLIRVCWWLN